MSAGKVSSHAAKAIHAMASGKWKECESHLDALEAWVDSRRRMCVALKGEEGGAVKGPCPAPLHAPDCRTVHDILSESCTEAGARVHAEAQQDAKREAERQAALRAKASMRLDVTGFHTSADPADYPERPVSIGGPLGALLDKAPAGDAAKMEQQHVATPAPLHWAHQAMLDGPRQYAEQSRRETARYAQSSTQFRASGGGVETREASGHGFGCNLLDQHTTPSECVRFTQGPGWRAPQTNIPTISSALRDLAATFRAHSTANTTIAVEVGTDHYRAFERELDALNRNRLGPTVYAGAMEITLNTEGGPVTVRRKADKTEKTPERLCACGAPLKEGQHPLADCISREGTRNAEEKAAIRNEALEEAKRVAFNACSTGVEGKRAWAAIDALKAKEAK